MKNNKLKEHLESFLLTKFSKDFVANTNLLKSLQYARGFIFTKTHDTIIVVNRVSGTRYIYRRGCTLFDHPEKLNVIRLYVFAYTQINPKYEYGGMWRLPLWKIKENILEENKYIV